MLQISGVGLGILLGPEAWPLLESSLCYSMDIAVGLTSKFNGDENEWSKQHLSEVTLGASLDITFSKPGHDTTQLLERDVVRSTAISDEYGT